MSTNTTHHESSAEPTDESLPADPEAVTVADTGAGLLVFAVETEHRSHLGREVEVARELVGFAGVDDWGVIRNALRNRGLGVGATTTLPEVAVEDVPTPEQ